MDIIVRPATPMDALFLTSILGGTKRYGGHADEFFGGSTKDLAKAMQYLEENIVFIAQKGDTIVGYSALCEIKESYMREGEVIQAGFWMKKLFVRPSYIRNGIGRKLVNKMLTYCAANQIKEVHALADYNMSRFYDKVGAMYIKNLACYENQENIRLYKFTIPQVLSEEENIIEAQVKENKEIQDNGCLNKHKQQAVKQYESEETSKKCEAPLLKHRLDELDMDQENDIEDDEEEQVASMKIKYENEIYINGTYSETDMIEKELYDREYARVSETYSPVYHADSLEQCEIENSSREELKNEKKDNEIIFATVSLEELRILTGKEIIEEAKQGNLENNQEIIEAVKEVVRHEHYHYKEENQEEEKNQEQNLIDTNRELDIEKNTSQDTKQDIGQGVKEAARELRKAVERSGLDRPNTSSTQVTKIEDKKNDTLIEYVSHKHKKTGLKSEKQKMLDGECYIAWGDDFVNDRIRARNLLKEFNEVDSEDRIKTQKILKKLFGSVGEYVHIEPRFKCSYGYNIHIGNNFYAGDDCIILDQARVIIGDNCILSPKVSLYTLAYPLNVYQRIAGYEYAKQIRIGNNVWIGGGAIINPGVTIGDDVVVLPGAVVEENIPQGVLVGGNPARIIKYLEASS